VDPDHVCLAGEGTGATVAAVVGLLTERMDVEAVAFSPRRYAKIKEFPLPLPELRGNEAPREKSLRVFVQERDDAWWTAELNEYAEIGLESHKISITSDPWEIELEAENAVRSALGLDARSATAATARRYILFDGDSPRARLWARLRALRSTAEDGIPAAVLEAPPEEAAYARIPTDLRPEAFAEEDALPRCPGPFGGTTVIVVPEGVTEHDMGGWLALEDDDPLAKEGRLYRLRVATVNGERSLPNVLSKLHAAGRNNALIVPATFSADAAFMRTLKRSVRQFDDQMTLHWLPGLGGRKVPISLTDTISEADHIEHELAVGLEPDAHRLGVKDRMTLPGS
jgi:hypothetical protein